jgi:hypothetical protein
LRGSGLPLGFLEFPNFFAGRGHITIRGSEEFVRAEPGSIARIAWSVLAHGRSFEAGSPKTLQGQAIM